MTFSDESYNLRIELDTKGCELSADEIEDMEVDLHTLRNLVEDFPVSDLHITVVYHHKARGLPRQNQPGTVRQETFHRRTSQQSSPRIRKLHSQADQKSPGVQTRNASR